MGLYMETEYKYDWLIKNALEIKKNDEIKDYEIKVCLIDNGFFYTAGVMFNQREFDYVSMLTDEREQKWFKVKKEIIEPLCPEWNKYMRENAS